MVTQLHVIPMKLVLEGINRGTGIQDLVSPLKTSGFLLEFIPYSVTGQE